MLRSLYIFSKKEHVLVHINVGHLDTLSGMKMNRKAERKIKQNDVC